MSPSPAETAHPLVAAARRLADEVLAPAAAAVDADVVPSSHVDALKASGLLGATGPVGAGGGDAPPAVHREIAEILVGACPSTWFVLAQHAGPLRAVAEGPVVLRDRLLPPLCDGRLLAATAFSQLRAGERCPTRVRRAAGGWVFDGVVPWLTSWGLADVLLLGGRSESGEVVFAVIDAVGRDALVASAPLAMAALSAARTVSLRLDGYRVPDDAIVAVTAYDDWAARDRLGPVNANPALFGVARAAVAELRNAGQGAAAERLSREVDRVRAEAYALADASDPDTDREERIALRVEAGELALRATAAAVTAGGGRAMALTAPAQRLARTALFLLVQAQTAEIRAAQLAPLAR
ncbi:MAG: acyl-CoA dehydrogenase family protein [Mycobacteriales bacterium]